MTWRVALCALAVLLSAPTRADTVWDRAKHPNLQAETRVLRSLYRTLSGTGDALDQMTSRTAFVDLARGKQFESAAIVVLLLRLRRQLGLEPDPRSLHLLEPRDSSPLPKTVAALRDLEVAHVLLAWGRAAEAESHLTQALTLAWLPEVRSEVLLLRGWIRFDDGRLAAAEADFEAILSMDVGRRRLAVTLMSLACVKEDLGDLDEARKLLDRGDAVEKSRAQASGMSLFAGEGLHQAAIARLEGLPGRLSGGASEDANSPQGEAVAE